MGAASRAGIAGLASTRRPRKAQSRASGGGRNSDEQPAGEIDSHDRAILGAGEKTALSIEAPTGDDVLVPVAGKQAEVERRVVGRHLNLGSGADLRLQQDFEHHPRPVRGDGERHGVILIAPDDLLGSRLVVGNGLRRSVGYGEVVLQRPADVCLVARDAVRTGVG